MANDTAKRLLARVKAIREALELSQEAFAEKAGLTYKYYQQVETGRKPNLQLPTLEKLAKGCGLGLSELLDFDTLPVILAEDRAEDGSQATSAKGARKSGKRGR